MTVPTPLFEDVSSKGFSDSTNWNQTSDPKFINDLFYPGSKPALDGDGSSSVNRGSVLPTGDTFSVGAWVYLQNYPTGFDIVASDYTNSGAVIVSGI